MQGDPKAPTFLPVRSELDFPGDESGILAFWKQHGIFHKTLKAETRATGPAKGTFVFYEGPPTANGMPHNGHVLTRAVKDVFPRFQTMRGYDVPRKAGWDTHGLPVEVEVEKELRIHGKAEIERYGVKPFIARCIDSVFRYTEAWERLTDKIGFWVDLDTAYVTYHRSYVESVWWALSELHKKGLLYRGHRVCWWWPQGGTALSAAEVGSNYKTVDDPSVYVAFPLVGQPGTALVAWTTTPWTLPSNMYAAVRADFEYVEVDAGGQKLILAAALREGLAKKLKKDLPVLRTMTGADLVGLRYEPPFDLYANEAAADSPMKDKVFTVIAAPFVTLDTGTGIVHIAPAFGEDDFEAHKQLYPGVLPNAPFCAVKPDGTFVEAFAAYTGRFVKDCDKDLIAELERRGRLIFKEAYRHEYPYCWRADDDPLIQLARPAWYIRTQPNKERAIENNRAVNWLPEHIKEGRFGDFLANNVDWALSRERYWGTPLNVWVCEKDASHEHAPASVADIEELNPRAFDHFRAAKAADPALNDHLIVHKPWIDEVTFPCPFHDGGPPGEPGSAPKPPCGGTMRRVTEVIDAWFDSGSMPFAQWGFPHAEGSKERFDQAFPADVISEAIDQTRGWFYSLLMISTLVFDQEAQKRLGLSRIRSYPHPYKTCEVLGHVCDREGKKESKSKGNYTPPEVILERVRMEFLAFEPAAMEGRLKEVGVKAADLAVKPGVAYIAREDYEGLDLSGEAAKVVLYRGDRADARVTMELKPAKKLQRRVVALHPDDLAKLGLAPGADPLAIKPNEVPGRPQPERVYIEDPATPAPGADAFRWFFYAASPPWTNTRHSLTNVRGAQKEFLVKLRNVYSFFVIYANIDGFDPSRGNPGAASTTPEALSKSEGYRPARERSLLDRWILSELALATREVTEKLEGYLLYDAAQRLVDLVDALSNWYVRRSRDRFWAPGMGQDKLDAYFTLYEVLVSLSKLIAPFTPFFAEELHQNLVRRPWAATQPESVHLCAYPDPDVTAIDEPLAREMRAVRELVSLGLSVRTNNKLKVRQPLDRADVVVSQAGLGAALGQHVGLIREELNVHDVRFLRPGEEGSEVRYVLKPNFRALGPKLGKKVQLAKQVLAKADASALRAGLATDGKVTIDLEGEAVDLGPEEIEVVVEAAEGYAAAGGRSGVVVLHTTLTDALRDEGLGREILSRVQGVRKELSLGFTERIRLSVDGSERTRRVAEAMRTTLAEEALAAEVVVGPAAFAGEVRSGSVDGEEVSVTVARLG